jgi:hypothetical protein
MGIVWGVTEVMGTTWGATEVSKAGNEGAAWGWVVGLPASILRAVKPLVAANGGRPDGIRGAGSGACMGATPGASSYRKMSKSLVRRGEATKGKIASSKTTCQKTMMMSVERSRH